MEGSYHVADCSTRVVKWGKTHNLESEDLAVDTDFPNSGMLIIIIANECNELDVGSGGASEWLELWATDSGERESPSRHCVGNGGLICT